MEQTALCNAHDTAPRWEHTAALAAACASNIIWGFSYLFTKVAMDAAGPDALLSFRFLFALAGMTLIIPFKKGCISLKGKRKWPLLLFGATSPLYFYFESYGILYTNATISGVVLAAVPIAAMALAALFLREYPPRRQALCSVFPVIGVVIITLSGNSLGVASPLGIAILVGTCLVSAATRVLNRRLALQYNVFERTYSGFLLTAVVCTLKALHTAGWSLREYIRPLADPAFLLPTLTLSVFCSILAGTISNYAAGKLSVVKFSALGTLTTVCATFAGVVFLHEPMTWVSLAGSVLIIAGVYLVTYVPRSLAGKA